MVSNHNCRIWNPESYQLDEPPITTASRHEPNLHWCIITQIAIWIVSPFLRFLTMLNSLKLICNLPVCKS